MIDHGFSIEVEAHPLLRPAAFTTTFPSPLEALPTPSWIMELLRLDARAPVRRDESLRMRVRDTLRYWGHKPAGRGKPASEYLVRAVMDGALGSINLAVDVCNVVSLHSGFPIALVDLDRARPPFRVARGPEDGRYVFNPSGQEMSLKSLICLYDTLGPCGNPVKDAQRIKTQGDTTRTLTVLWGVADFQEQQGAAVAWYQEILRKVGGSVRDVPVRQPPSNQ
jgi:DNA/RNA-binding domain of Phe-tRNA-synthetase-like protein